MDIDDINPYELLEKKTNPLIKKYRSQWSEQRINEFKTRIRDENDSDPYQEDLPRFKTDKSRVIKAAEIKIKHEEKHYGLLANTQEEKKRKLLQGINYVNDTFTGRLVRYGLEEDLRITNNQAHFYFDHKEFTKLISFKNIDKYFLYSGELMRLRFTEDDLSILRTCAQLDVKEILPLEEMQIEEEEEFQQMDPSILIKNDQVNIIVAAGPYEADYFLLFQLIELIKTNKVVCEILILMGPFAQDEQEYTHLIETIVIELPKTLILFVNSTEEESMFYPLPQPPFKVDIFDEQSSKKIKKDQNINPNIMFVGNPSVVTFQDLDIAILNADIIRDVFQQSVIGGYHEKEKLKLTMKSFLQQKSFVPAYPISYPIDITRDFSLNPPHIFLTTSQYGTAYKLIDDTVFLYMQPLTKGKYAAITYHSNNSFKASMNIRIDIELI